MPERDDLWWGVIAVTNTETNDKRVVLPRMDWFSLLPVPVVDGTEKIGELEKVEHFGTLVLGSGHVKAGTKAFGIAISLDQTESFVDDDVEVVSEGTLYGLSTCGHDEVAWPHCIAAIAKSHEGVCGKAASGQ